MFMTWVLEFMDHLQFRRGGLSYQIEISGHKRLAYGANVQVRLEMRSAENGAAKQATATGMEECM